MASNASFYYIQYRVILLMYVAQTVLTYIYISSLSYMASVS